MRRWRRRSTWCAACVFAAGALGCGGGGSTTYPVTGRVTFPDGKPLSTGTVEFQPVAPSGDGEKPSANPTGRISARGMIQADGSYALGTFGTDDGAVEGKHRVLVTPGLPPGPINPASPSKPVIHSRFQRYETSGLEFTVTPDGPSTFDITVERP